jgi:hypothetical protein
MADRGALMSNIVKSLTIAVLWAFYLILFFFDFSWLGFVFMGTGLAIFILALKLFLLFFNWRLDDAAAADPDPVPEALETQLPAGIRTQLWHRQKAFFETDITVNKQAAILVEQYFDPEEVFSARGARQFGRGHEGHSHHRAEGRDPGPNGQDVRPHIYGPH